ncbi:MAG TPA: RdgB/HAM1 family non-canonical purine NTP pyrophosphatase [Bryobacteraceae bacterium]|nr:RdgB/HAM1 family non-canonical purine NTP pyrophosphatase [Bryobacteraceae bacterium]
MTLYCGTGNPGKLREFRLAIEHFGEGRLSVEPVPGLSGVPPCEETGATFEENAVLKAVYYSQLAPGLLFADDSGLEVRALGGAPGVSSARFAGPGATDEANNRLLLEKLRGVEDRAAQFVCMIALADAGKLVATFRGIIEGHILHEPRGANGFGYDPLFYHPPFACTFGEATGEQKLAVSHRGRALAVMVKYLLSRKTA